MDPQSRTYQGLLRLKKTGFSPVGILDIGAYEAWWTRSIRQIFPDSYILMVDALAEKTPFLESACRELGNANYLISVLGGADIEKTDFFVVNAPAQVGLIQTGSSKYKENTGYTMETRQLQQLRLDRVIPLTGRKFDLVKLDVQGAELDVLRGAGDYIKDFEFALLEVSTLEYNSGAPLVAEVLREMDEFGFVLYDILDEMRIGNNGPLLQFDALFAKKTSPFRPAPPF